MKVKILPRIAILFAMGNAIVLFGGTAPLRGQAHDHRRDVMSQVHALYGQYPVSREASGTSWQPDSAPMEGMVNVHGPWVFTSHGFLFGVYDRQTGPRGAEQSFISNMVAFQARTIVQKGTIGFRTMFSLDALSGKEGYPLLLQTGEAAEGKPLIDRQHPHDLFSELSLTYSYPTAEKNSLFIYAGLPGEPALGPPVYLQRGAAADNPEAPLTHHWMDSTHVTFGVVTLGYVVDRLKLETSAFRGREPDENRWDLEGARLDSFAFRVSYNLLQSWAFQASYGLLKGPEELAPNVDIGRYTASLIYSRAYRRANQQVTFAWGLNDKDPGAPLNGFLLESVFRIAYDHTFFFRVERVEKDDLFLKDDPLSGEIFTVNKGTLGYVYNFLQQGNFCLGAGGLASIGIVPGELRSVYGDAPVSHMFFLRAKLL